MKRLQVFSIFLGVSVMAVWSIFQALPVAKSSPVTKYDNAPIPVYDATGAMQKAVNIQSDEVTIPVTGSDARIVPVYDATGAMLDAINPNKKVITVPAYDATGAMLDAITP